MVEYVLAYLRLCEVPSYSERNCSVLYPDYILVYLSVLSCKLITLKSLIQYHLCLYSAHIFAQQINITINQNVVYSV
jgi:hypothetical protein